MNKIVQIGNGKAARFHRQNYPRNARLVGLVVRDVAKNWKLAETDSTLPKDILITDDLESVVDRFGAVIWDIVSDDETHLAYVKQIVSLDARAKILLAKTPYEARLIHAYQRIMAANPLVKISVTENYAVSNVTIRLKEMLRKYNINPKRVIIEFTKNRLRDIENGRFIHPSLGVLGYEGSHILTILEKLGLFLKQVKSAKFEDLVIADKILKNHGSCLIEGVADQTEIVIFTSMIGKVKYKFRQLGIESDIGYGDETRHRVAVVEGDGFKVVGQYDPVPGLGRFWGRVTVINGDKVIEKAEDIEDNTVKKILAQQICYLANEGCEQPMSVADAEKFSILEEVYNRFAN